MTVLDIGDPVAAAELLRAIDQRVDVALSRRLPIRGYGIVASVSGNVAALYVRGQATSSPGFIVPANLRPRVGELVGYVIDGGDRYLTDRFTAGDSGTSFPASPVVGERFWRTDLAEEYYWNGANWVSTAVYSTQMQSRGTQPTAVSAVNRWDAILGSVVVVRWRIQFFPNGVTQNATNYWYFDMSRASADQAALTFVSFTFNNHAASQWHYHEASFSQPMNAGGRLEAQALPAGAGAGGMYASVHVEYRRRGT